MTQTSPNFYEDLPPNLYGEQPDTELLHQQRLDALKDFEDLLWRRVEEGSITAVEAEEAYWAFIAYVENPNVD